MQLDSGLFVLFLVLTWLLWRLLPKGAAPGILLLASLVFYASSNLTDLGLMLLLIGFNYAVVRGLTVWKEDRKRGALFALAIVVDASVLLFYKWACLYLNVRAIPEALHLLLPLTPANTVAFPLGLSFLTFQIISCVTDVYRRSYQWTTGAWSFYLYALFFPQISAGPIPRAAALVPQLTGPRRPLAPGDLEAGIALFTYGLFKKMVIANRLQIYTASIFSTEMHLSTIPVLIAFVFNALYLYADFSGYTDMARGAARAFGINLAENFDHPFRSESITEFWRRWHMTLSTWLKDYLYMPLVIRLRNFGKLAIVFSFLFTFLVCGLWHRLSLPFALFGLAHGSALSIEFLSRQIRQAWMTKWPLLESPWIGRTYVFCFFVLTNVLFRVTDMTQAGELYKKALIPGRPTGLDEIFGYIGPLPFLLNFIALGLWAFVIAARTRWAETRCAWFVLLCAVLILLLGKMAEAGFVYVAF